MRFIATTRNIYTNQADPMSRLPMHVLAAFSEFEREMITEHVRAGIAVARKNHVQLGYRHRIFDRARALHRAGSSQREVCRALCVGKGTVQRLLSAGLDCDSARMFTPGYVPAQGSSPDAPLARERHSAELKPSLQCV